MLKNNGFHNRHSPILRAFSPLSLFSGGAPGAWYDPSDLTTLFQDSAGTTPVTAVEQPVGLMLDKSQGLVLGPELVTSPYVVSGTGWTSASSSITHTGAVGVGAVTTYIIPVVGKMYVVTFTASDLSGATSFVNFGSDTSNTSLQKRIATAGNYSFKLTAINTTGLRFSPYEGADFGVTISNISVRELPGNHAFQATSASRPVLSARYNLLTKTEDFSDAAWVKTPSDVATYQGTGLQAVITANFGVAPDGTSTADRVQLNCNGGTTTPDRSGFNQVFPTVIVGLSYTSSFYIKPLDSTTDSQILNSNLGILAAGPSAISSTIEDVGGGWKKVVKVFTPNVPNGTFRFQLIGSTGPLTFDGLIWGASLVPANQSTLPYQRVNTATDYATTGFLPYLKFDGVDDSLSTNSISFTSTDKMSVFAGVRKLSDAAQAILYELSTDTFANNGAFLLWAPGAVAGSNYYARVRGSLVSNAVTGASYRAPITNVATMLADIAGDSVNVRLNAASAVTSTSDLGTGNFGNYPLFIGRRNNATLPFNGQMYSMIIVGKSVTAGELSNTETYVNQKTGAYA